MDRAQAILDQVGGGIVELKEDPASAAEEFLFTSESVNEGHPDKLCDAVSDAILDACLAGDPDSHVACESACKDNMVMIFGEITTNSKFDYDQVVRDALRQVGYDSEDKGINYKTCEIINRINKQSPDIAQGVHLNKRVEDIGAGDQGIMFGYASDETPEMMPLTHVLSTQLGSRLTEVRKNGTLKWVRPDGKTQVTVAYKIVNGAMIPQRVHTVVISTQHSPDVSNEQIASDLLEHVIKPVIPGQYLDDKTIYHLNPSGRFVTGGPAGDAGLTGRKIIIDTYGGWGAHGGGAFSGKDPSKVDRSAAYAARQAAKSVVASGLARRCLLQLSYAIGVPYPLSVNIETYGTVQQGHTDNEICALVQRVFDLRPGIIVRDLKLRRPIFQQTAAYGHFGRSNPDFVWEQVKEMRWDM